MKELLDWFHINYPRYVLEIDADPDSWVVNRYIKYKISIPSIMPYWSYGGEVICGWDYMDRTTSAIVAALKISILEVMSRITKSVEQWEAKQLRDDQEGDN